MADVADRERVAEHLNKVIELDYDAVAAYDAAIERLEEPRYKQKLQEFRDDHNRHIEKLGKLVEAQGEKPATSGDAKKLLTKGQVVIGGLVGDGAILEAMKLNEDQTNMMYEKEARQDNLPVEIREALEQGLADERRHRSWIRETLSELT